MFHDLRVVAGAMRRFTRKVGGKRRMMDGGRLPALGRFDRARLEGCSAVTVGMAVMGCPYHLQPQPAFRANVKMSQSAHDTCG